MAKSKRRGNAYWKPRIKLRDPAMFELIEAGKLSVRAARLKLGLMRQPTALNALKRAWTRASPSEKREFAGWLKSRSGGAHSLVELVDAMGALKATTVAEIERRMAAARLKHADVSEAMGYSRHDPRLGFALRRQGRPSPEFLKRLGEWLTRV